MVFDVPKSYILNKRWIYYACKHLRGFKTQLTSDYITNPKSNLVHPTLKYIYINTKVWYKFVESCNSPTLMSVEILCCEV